MSYSLKTSRLGLRNWLDSDISVLHKINSDPSVMEFFPALPTLKQTEEFVHRMQKHFKQYGYCYFAVDELDSDECIGFIGLMHTSFESDFTPAIDIGWRLKSSKWGKGLATEGALASLKLGFEKFNIEEIISVAPSINKPSIKVMEKIGLKKEKDFIHPALLNNEELKSCELYKIRKTDINT